MATSPSKATVTAIRADTAEVADQICRTILETPGSRSPTSTIASSAAARPAAINAATAGASAADAHNTGSTPAAVSNAIAARVDGRRQQGQRADDGQHRGDAAGTGQPRVVAVAEVGRGERNEQRKGRGDDSGGVQPDPVLAELDEQRCGRDGEHERDQQHRDAIGDDRRQHDQRDQHEKAEVLRVPAPSQREAAAADHRRDHQADGRGHPVVDRGDRDDVHIRSGDTGRGEGDRADPPARAGVQPEPRRRRAPRRAERLRRHGFPAAGCPPGRRARAAARRRSA